MSPALSGPVRCLAPVMPEVGAAASPIWLDCAALHAMSGPRETRPVPGTGHGQVEQG